jgi:hypothetical protein
MSGLLLDTNVLSEFNRRGDPYPLVKQWLEAADTGSLYVSVPPSQGSDLESSFSLQANGERSWRNGSIGTCLNGSTIEIYPFTGRLQIDGEYFAPKRR